MTQAKFIEEVTVTDPDTNRSVKISIYKEIGCGMLFGIASKYLDDIYDDEPVPSMYDNGKVLLKRD